jgi:hypothetical protein
MDRPFFLRHQDDSGGGGGADKEFLLTERDARRVLPLARA